MRGFWSTLPRPIRILAPMEDVTDHVFRDLTATLGGPDVFFTEFILADAVAGVNSGAGPSLPGRLRRGRLDHPLVAQIWGTKPETYRAAAENLRRLGFDGVDINMGCPIRKIRKRGACSQLIANPGLAAELILAAKEGAGELPVSVKTRIGLDRPITEEWCGFLLEQGIDVLTVHGRTADEMSEGRARWEEIRRVVRLRDAGSYRTLIVGNGGVRHHGEFLSKARRYGVEGVMVGRGIFEDPYIFAGGGRLRRFRHRSREEKLTLLLRHIKAFESAWERERNYEVLKKFYKVYLTGFEDAEEIRSRLNETHDLESAEEIVRQAVDSS
ncbi:MAG: tRNA dihydrouridine synthase [Alkalispirochaetaceae bacterium]